MWLQISFRKLQKKENKKGGREEGKIDSQSQAQQKSLLLFLDDGPFPPPANLSTLSPRRETSQTWTCPSGRDIGWGAQHKQLDVSPSRLSSLSRSFPSFSLQMLGKETRREKHYFPPETKTNTLRVEDST